MSNDNASSSDQDPSYYESGGTTRYNMNSNGYPSSRGGYSGRGYYRNGTQQPKYTSHSYDQLDNSSQNYHNNGRAYSSNRGHGRGANTYRSDYYYNGQGQPQVNNKRYYSGRGSYSSYEQSSNYNQSYQTENDYQYYGNNHRGGSHNNFHTRGSYQAGNPIPSRSQYPAGKSYYSQQDDSKLAPKRSLENSNAVPAESINRPLSQSSSGISPAIISPTRPIEIEKRIDKTESPFLYLTDLDQSTDDTLELDKIRQVLRDSDVLNKKIEEAKLKFFKDDLELGLLSTQCERDSLNVQLTQEKLDSLLMQV